jgi:hypothetical protein
MRTQLRPRPAYAAAHRWIGITPVVFVGAWALLLTLRSTRRAALHLLDENQPVELLTFAVLIVAGVGALALARQARRRGEPPLVAVFYALFGLGLLVVGMEEVAWGQWFFHFETPAALKEFNAQRETTLHNFVGMQGKLEIFPLVYAAGGLAGIGLGRRRAFRSVAVPSWLAAWFLTIGILGILDFVVDIVPISHRTEETVEVLAEVGELLVAVSAALYLGFAWRRFEVEGKAPAGEERPRRRGAGAEGASPPEVPELTGPAGSRRLS